MSPVQPSQERRVVWVLWSSYGIELPCWPETLRYPVYFLDCLQIAPFGAALIPIVKFMWTENINMRKVTSLRKGCRYGRLPEHCTCISLHVGEKEVRMRDREGMGMKVKRLSLQMKDLQGFQQRDSSRCF